MSYYIECNDGIIIGINNVGIGCELWYFELEINLFGFRIILIVFGNVVWNLNCLILVVIFIMNQNIFKYLPT